MEAERVQTKLVSEASQARMETRTLTAAPSPHTHTPRLPRRTQARMETRTLTAADEADFGRTRLSLLIEAQAANRAW